MSDRLPQGYPKQDSPAPITWCVDCGLNHYTLLNAKLCCLDKKNARKLKKEVDQ